jgi:hypothetical protein
VQPIFPKWARNDEISNGAGAIAFSSKWRENQQDSCVYLNDWSQVVAIDPLFVACERFDPSDGDRWERFSQWARIPALAEVVSLDTMLCPTILHDLSDEDWQHNVHEDFRLNYFYDLDYLIRRSAAVLRKNILGLYRNPEGHINSAPGSRAFSFLGYDLIEEATQISALTNCGGFPETFSNNELNEHGLIPDFGRSSEIRKLLPQNNPAEPHAKCELYAIWRLIER